jgi:hypothetical protein
MAKLKSTLHEYARASKKDFQQIVNDKALDWVFKSLQQTDRANAQEIAVELGQTGTKLSKSRTTGQLKAGRKIFKDDSLAARIINARLKKKGEPLLFGREMEKAVRKMVNSRIRAISFIKSGWLAAVQKLKRFSSDPRIRAQANDNATKIRGQPKGFAIAANQVLEPVATIVNTATKESPKAARVAEKGLSLGARIIEADMRTYIERKHQKTADKFSAK